jgi:hypothetical protein
MTEAVDFVCPRCTSRYKLVRVRAEPGLRSHLIHCRVCKEPFAPMDREYALKYFLVDKAVPGALAFLGCQRGFNENPGSPSAPKRTRRIFGSSSEARANFSTNAALHSRLMPPLNGGSWTWCEIDQPLISPRGLGEGLFASPQLQNT